MRASVEPFRDLSLDVLDLARDQAAELVGTSAAVLAAGIDHQADRLAATIDELADKVPVVTVEVRGRRSRKPLLVVVALVVLGVVAVVVARRASAPPPADPPAPVPAGAG